MNASSIIIFLLSVILSCITIIHIYWFFGGEKGLDASLPHDIEGIKKRFSMPMIRLINCIFIGPVITVLVLLIISLYNILPFLNTYKSLIYFWFAFIFILRGTVGWVFINKFSKKEIFIRNNTRIYSPIALSIGILFFFLYFL